MGLDYTPHLPYKPSRIHAMKKLFFCLIPVFFAIFSLLITSAHSLAQEGPDHSGFVAYISPDGGLSAVTRPGIQDPLAALQTLSSPPPGYSSAVPDGVTVESFSFDASAAKVGFSSSLATVALDDARVELIYAQVRATLSQFGIENTIRIESGGRPLHEYLPPAPSITPRGSAGVQFGPLLAPGSSLAGKTISLSPGHGKVWTGSSYVFERPVYCSPLSREDDHNVEIMTYLDQYLRQDGGVTKVYRCLNKSYGTHSGSGEPWWRVSAGYWIKQNGYPCSVYASSTGDCTLGAGASESSDSLRSRPLASDYDAADIYVSLHSNGLNGDCTGSTCPNGTCTYYCASAEHATWATISQQLATSINNSIVDSIRTRYGDTTWRNRGAINADGNQAETRIPNRAAVLIELAFHDTCDRDGLYLQDNFFRSTTMWATYKGICDYFGVSPTWAYYSDELVSHDIPTTMAPGSTVTAHLTFRNRGVLWSDARQFRLGAVGDSDPFTTTTRHNVGGEIGPGETKTFTVTLTAPATPGAYTTDWRMLREGVEWFGQTLSVTVNVGDVGHPATWGPYNLTQSRSIYSPGNQGASLRTGWYTTTAGTGAARSILKAADATMAHMPDASLVSGSTFTVAFTQAGTYSTTADNPLNIYRISQAWDAATVHWASPWAAGGAYTSVGTASQPVVYPAEGAIYTFSIGAGNNFPYGVMMKGDVESSISYRKAWLGSGTYPTLTVNYTTPTPSIRNWAYLGWFDQGVTADRQLRLDTDQVAGTYAGVPVTETTMAPRVGASSYGNSYGIRQWAQGSYTNDLVNLNSSAFYNAVHENAVTYCFVYVHNSKGSAIANAYLGIGSDDGCKVWWNGSLAGSFVDGRAVSADANFWGPITINAGWNKLLVKVENGTTGHGVYARFANANRTALTDKAFLSFYTTDSTAPGSPQNLLAAGAVSGAWQNMVSSPTFTWTSGTDAQGSSEGVSGVRGQKVYFGANGAAAPDTFQSALSFSPGSLASGTYFFKVATVDYALNESGPASFVFMLDNTPPAGVTMGFGPVTADSIAVTATATDAHSGIHPATGYAFSRTGAGSGPTGPAFTWTSLVPNTEYTGLTVTVRDQVAPTPNSAASAPQSRWTLSLPPAAGSIIPDTIAPVAGSAVTWTAPGGFGQGTVQKYKYAWNKNAAYAWTGTEPDWSGGTLQTVPDSSGTWYLHVKGFNGENVENGAFAYAVTAAAPAALTLHISRAGIGTNLIEAPAEPSMNYLLQFATNLSPSITWFDLLTTNASTNGVWSVIDDQATNAMRFYRSRQATTPPE